MARAMRVAFVLAVVPGSVADKTLRELKRLHGKRLAHELSLRLQGEFDADGIEGVSVESLEVRS